MHDVSPRILGIESSCDDTAAAVVDGEGRVVASVVSRQLESHRPFGGVVPEIASREHLRNWPAVSAETLERAGLGLDDIDVVAATRGPGLIGSLLVGLSIGRALAYARGLPFHAIHHLEGHLYSPFLHADGSAAEEPPTGFHGLVVSGGHTALYRVDDGEIETLAETRDDAFGEVFDKIGKRLGLPYPQGPRVDELAETGVEGKVELTVARCSDGSLDFSYSGLKSQALIEIERLERAGVDCDLGDAEEAPSAVRALLAGFRAAAIGQLVDRLERLRRTGRAPDLLAVSGGAAANRLMRRRLTAWADEHGIALRLVPLAFSGDNAAMIAHAALLRERRGQRDDPLRVEAASRLPMP
ncbi:MAG: tRNA (adenosine(37)-N6)-threonylcarbamoyltransferase complex transferase subunit TsaD [Acidobacteria bacterium]|nr:tRNA (adenosine(37)-N6)-threonylcarbamoyltransferase complex transferase subunit TsaD [Acidobacteriota bacterium]